MSKKKNEAEMPQEESEEISEETEMEEPVEESDESEQPQKESMIDVTDPFELLDTLDGLDENQKEMLRNGMLREQDYTRKTQELARQRRELEQYIQSIKQPQNIKPEEPEIPTDPREFYKSVYEKSKTDAVQEAMSQVQNQLAMERDIASASSVDNRLNDERFGRVIASLVQSDPDVVQGNKTLTQATKDAIAFYDGLSKEMVQKTKQDISHRALNKKMVTSKRTSPIGTESEQPKDIYEAYQQALEELGGE